MRKVLHRAAHLRDRPFASALAIMFLGSSIVGLTGLSLTVDVLKSLVPEWFLVVLSVAYGLAGLLLLIGLMFQRGDWEAAGCVLALSGVVVRAIAILVTYGVVPETVALVLFYFVFGGACVERLRQILFGERIIHVISQIELKPNDQEEEQ